MASLVAMTEDCICFEWIAITLKDNLSLSLIDCSMSSRSIRHSGPKSFSTLSSLCLPCLLLTEVEPVDGALSSLLFFLGRPLFFPTRILYGASDLLTLRSRLNAIELFENSPDNFLLVWTDLLGAKAKFAIIEALDFVPYREALVFYFKSSHLFPSKLSSIPALRTFFSQFTLMFIALATFLSILVSIWLI